VVLVLLEVGERDFDDAALEGVVGVLETSCAVYKGLADTVWKKRIRKPLCSLPFLFVLFLLASLSISSTVLS